MAGRAEHYRGHDGIRQYFADVAKVWHEFVVIPEDFRAAAGSVVVFGRVRAYNDETTVDSPVVWVWKLRGDLVSSGQVFPTPAAAMASVEPSAAEGA
jgi:ketosteroid isomerase-like protein